MDDDQAREDVSIFGGTMSSFGHILSLSEELKMRGCLSREGCVSFPLSYPELFLEAERY